jgi:hypothetical protein
MVSVADLVVRRLEVSRRYRHSPTQNFFRFLKQFYPASANAEQDWNRGVDMPPRRRKRAG